ncbi:MAG: membrane integrity-associated transporter subunit PqiC [Methylococcaceae bacterium]|nr:membrane integrity-associated transporter subunit PqiC [Methylococcaceae bacterium]
MVCKAQTLMQVLALSTLLTACVSAPPTHFYVLEAKSLSGAVAAHDTKISVIGIGPLSIPTLLDRKQIITRSGQNTVQIAEFHQWAAPLHDSMIEVITQNVTSLQSRHVIRSYPWSAYGAVNYRVIIDIDRFDTKPGSAVVLQARWAIMNEIDHVVLANHHSSIEHALKDTTFSATVKALSGVLYEFSQQISQALDDLKQ